MSRNNNSEYFNSDIFILPVTAGGFFRWLNHTLEKIEPIAGLIGSSWKNEPESIYVPVTLNIARVIPGETSAELDLLFEISIVPVEADQTMVELDSSWGKHNDPAYDAIIWRIENTWPRAQKDRADRYNPIARVPSFDVQAVIDKANLNETNAQIHREYLTLQNTARVIRRPVQNKGGHPPLECNEWAYNELCKRPRDRAKIFEEWTVKYQEEVGAEAAELRDLRDTFNGAMRHRRQKGA